MFSGWISSIFIIFTAFGFFPEFPKIRNIRNIILSIHILIAFLGFINLLFVFFYMNKSYSKLDMINQLSQLFSTSFAYAITVIESFVQRKSLNRFWKIHRSTLFRENFGRSDKILLDCILEFFEYFVAYNVCVCYLWTKSIMQYEALQHIIAYLMNLLNTNRSL